MKKGDFLLADYAGRVVSSHDIFDTTVEKTAREGGAYSEGNEYKPVLIVIGKGMVVKGVEEALEKMEKEGEEATITLPPEKAFGRRDARLVRTVPYSIFREKNIEPAPGMFVDIAGMAAKIQSVSGGRVRIDFNHPLAGREVIYWVKIVKLITLPEEKIEAFTRHLRIKAKHRLADGRLVIEMENEPDKKIREFFEREIKGLVPEVKVVEFSVIKKGTGK